VYVVQMFGKPAASITGTLPAKQPVVRNQATPAKQSDTTNVVAVLGAASEMYTEIEQPPSDSNGPELMSDFTSSSVLEAQSISFTEKTLVSPKQTIGWLYLGLAGFVIVALILMVFIEIRMQHPKNVLAGSALLLLIVTLLYVYQNVLFGQVIVL